MNGLLDIPPQEGNPVADQARKAPSGIGNNISIQELLQFLFKRGLLSPTAQALTPVDPVNNQSMQQTMGTRQRQMQELGL